jgi:hypothetical protein
MEDLCPGYGTRWRWLDLQYAWLWSEALAPLPLELRQELVALMQWIVRRRYLALLLASKYAPSMGYVGICDWDSWRARRATPPLALCLECPNKKRFDECRYKLWKDDVVRVVESSIHSRDHETMQLRMRGDDSAIRLIVHVNTRCEIEAGHRDVQLTLRDDTIWCCFREYHTYPEHIGTSQYQMPLMQLAQ